MNTPSVILRRNAGRYFCNLFAEVRYPRTRQRIHVALRQLVHNAPQPPFLRFQLVFWRGSIYRNVFGLKLFDNFASCFQRPAGDMAIKCSSIRLVRKHCRFGKEGRYWCAFRDAAKDCPRNVVLYCTCQLSSKAVPHKRGPPDHARQPLSPSLV